MEANFWLDKWGKNEIAFHQSEANPLLVKYFNELLLKMGCRVFLPLCGKTLDIYWLLSNGYHVVGAELSKLAIDQLFVGLGVEPKIEKLGQLEHYSAANIDIFVGDIFQLTKEILGSVDAIYDRAALVALPTEMRIRYSKHLITITTNAMQLLICYEYDQSKANGPPFSISNEEVDMHYNNHYKLVFLFTQSVSGGLRGNLPATENVWLLKQK